MPTSLDRRYPTPYIRRRPRSSLYQTQRLLRRRLPTKPLLIINRDIHRAFKSLSPLNISGVVMRVGDHYRFQSTEGVDLSDCFVVDQAD